MAYKEALIKLSWGGLIDNQDIWTNSVMAKAVALDADGTAISDDDFAKRLFDIVKDVYNKGDHAMCQFNTIQWAKVAFINADGKYSRDAGVYIEPGNGTPGHSGANNRTPTDTLVVSLVTDKKRGRAHRGRIYPPAFALNTTQAGLADPNLLDEYAQNFADMISRFNSLHNGPIYTPSLPGSVDGLSVVVASKIGAGATEVVTSVEVGTVFDTQRRRRNRIPEVYTAKNIPA